MMVFKKAKFGKYLMVLLLISSLFVIAACNDDNDAVDDSIYTNPNNGVNDNDRYDDNLNNNGTRDQGTINNEINEGTINDDDRTFEDEARDIIDDTEDVIEGKDGKINNR